MTSADTSRRHVIPVDGQQLEDTPQEYKPRMRKVAAEALAAAASIARNVKLSYEEVQSEHEHPYEAIIRSADTSGCDLIVTVSHGRRGVSALLLGSETMKVLSQFKNPVLVVR